MKTRILAFLLSALFVLPLFAACGGNEPPTNEEPETSTEGIKLGDTSNRIYKVISPEGLSEEGTSILASFMASFRSVSGINLSMATDVSAETEKEILFGYTNRKESLAAMEKLDFHDFSVTREGEKIVIAAHTAEMLREAGEYFNQKMVEKVVGDKTTSAYFKGDDYQKKSGEAFLFTKKNNLKDYTVIYKKGDTFAAEAANVLSDAVKERFGITLPCKDDSESEGTREILIGATNRALSRKALPSRALASEFAVKAEEERLAIVSKNDAQLKTAVTTFCKLHLTGGFSYTFNISASYNELRSVYFFMDDHARAKDTDARIMSFNVLCELWTEEAKNLTARAETAAATILHFAPDVVGLQEMSSGWYTELEAHIGSRYAFTRKNKYTTLAYNKETVKLIKGGTKVFSKGNNASLRLMEWCVFETIATKERFVAISTHWDLPKNDEQYGYRMIHSNEMADFVKEMESTYHCPVIAVGDYNSTPSSEPYQNFVAKCGYKTAKNTAAVKIRSCQTYHDLFVLPSTSPSENVIDHIFGSDGATFLLYNVLVDQLVADTSDHCPIYADVKLN